MQFFNACGKIVVSFLVLLPGPAALAGWYLEPEIGAYQGTYDLGTGNSTGKDSGAGWGATLGYDFMPIFIGAEVKGGILVTVPDQAGNPGTTQSLTAAGPVLGVGFTGFPLRLWAGYYLLDASSFDYPNPVTGTSTKFTNSGSALKLGVGLKFVGVLSLNLEYEMHTYTKQKNESAGTDSSLNPNTKFNGYYLSLSLPIGS